jgi:hypothetical protein
MGRGKARQTRPADEGRGVFRSRSPEDRSDSSADALPRRATRSGVQVRDEARRIARQSGNSITSPENISTYDVEGERAQFGHLPLRQRLTAAHGWAREATAQRATATRFASWLLVLEHLEAPETFAATCERLAKEAAELARACSGFAYGLLGRDETVAPEPDWPREAQPIDRAAFVLAIASDGCIGASIVAAQMAEASVRPVEGAVAPLLSRMAQGSRDQAKWSWRVLAWLLDVDVDGGSRAILLQAIGARLREIEARHRQVGTLALQSTGRVGRLGPADRSRVALIALRDEVRPRLEAVTLVV